MKRAFIVFLKIMVVLVGIAVFVFLLWEPSVEGVNASATTLSEIYFDDPFLAYAYAVSIAFFVALYKTFKLLGYIGRNEAISQLSINALRTIKYCALILIVGTAWPVAYLFIVRPGDDIAGGVAMGLFIIVTSTVVALMSAKFERMLRIFVQKKS